MGFLSSHERQSAYPVSNRGMKLRKDHTNFGVSLSSNRLRP